MARTYHHGNLRPVLLAAAIEAIEQDGPAALSLRDLARRAGVSHAAPAHHFGDKAGLLTALATEGYGLLADAVSAAGDEIVEAGVAYIRFAIEHRAHFEVMFQPGLYRHDDPEVAAARERADQSLVNALAAVPKPPAAEDGPAARLAAWSIAHGFAGLWISGALPAGLGSDPAAAARPVIGRLFR
jgi:AcrR family transcriptional regulator